MRLFPILCLAIIGQQSAAQDLSVNAGDVRACYRDTPVGAGYPDCLGAASNACQGQAGGSTTIGISECIMAETAVWDELLNEAYGDLRAEFGAQEDVPGEASGADLKIALRDAQRAWIAFRDADCGLAYSMWLGGSIRTIVSANCQLTHTASRALALRDMGQP